MTVVTPAKYSISPNSSKRSDFSADGHHISTHRILAEFQSVEPWLIRIAKQSR